MEQVCKRREKGERPVIGVTPLLDQEQESLWMLPGYFQGVLDAGGIPMMLPLCDDRALLQDVADLCDGFLFTGGYDVSPTVYGEATAYDTVIASPERDDMEAALLWEILRRDRPLFGICRGLQIINAALGDIEKLQGKEGPTGVPSGFSSIDRITQGWQPSDLIILAARPSVGKTAFALNLARNAAVIHHMPVAFFSLEMSAIQLAKRLMTSESGLSADKIKGGVKLEPYEWEQLEYKLKALAKAPLYIDDTPGIPVMEFRTKIKTLVKNRGVRLVFVDYLQLMQGPAELRGMREQEVAAISRTLKATAKELDVPIIALSQLSRNAVQRQGGSGKPQLSDLRESGSIEQDADMVIFIHRPDYVGLSENAGDKEATEIIIAKHRNGETADIDMRFRSEQIKFMEMDESLDVQAGRAYESGMNSDLGGGFPSSFGAPGEFDNSAF